MQGSFKLESGASRAPRWHSLLNDRREQSKFSDCQYLEYVGHIKKSYSQPKSNRSSYDDTELAESMKTLGLPYDPMLFAVMRGTLEGAVKATRRFNKPSFTPDLDILSVKDAFVEFEKVFENYYDTCPEAKDEELIYVPASSPGAFFKLFYGLKHTGDIFQSQTLINELHAFHEQPEYPTLWSTSAKQELLTMEKVETNEPRTFIIPDKRYHYHCLKMEYHQHLLLKELSKSGEAPFALGTSFYRKGFNSVLERLLPNEVIGAGDCSKWDSSTIWWLYENVVIPLRVKLYKPPTHYAVGGVTKLFTQEEREKLRQDYAVRMTATYKDMVNACIMLPNGEVIQKQIGENSGKDSTSDDNTIMHFFIQCYMVADYQRKHKEFANFKQVLYADDHVFSCKQNTLENYETRMSYYKLFGILLKPAADLVTPTLEGQTFLGYTARWANEHKCYVPVYPIDKALATLVRPDGHCDELLRYIRINAIRTISYFTPYRQQLAQLARMYYKQAFLYMQNTYSMSDSAFASLKQPLTDRDIEDLWLGYEDGKRKIFQAKSFLASMPLQINVNEKGQRSAAAAPAKRRRQGRQNNKRARNPKRNRAPRRNGARPRRAVGKNVRTTMDGALNYATSFKVNQRQQKRERGTDVLYELQTSSVPPSTTQVLASFNVNPFTMIPNSRLKVYGRLYEKFHINSLRIYWKTAVATTFSGDSYVWHCSNPLTQFNETGLPLQQRLTNQIYNLCVPVTKTGMLSIPSKQFANGKNYQYYCNPEDSVEEFDCFAGQLFIASKGPLQANTDYGTWYVDWDITFHNPQTVEEDPSSGQIITGTVGQAGANNPLDAPWTILPADTDLPMVASTSGAGTVLLFESPGTYRVCLTSQGTGGAGLTTTSTVVLTSGSFQNTNLVNGGGTQKMWDYLFNITTAGTTATITEAGQTHPNGIYFGSVVYVPPAAPMPKAYYDRQAVVERQTRLDEALAFFEKHKASLAPPSTVTTSVDYYISDNQNNPLEHVTGTSTSDVGLLDVAVIDPSRKKGKRKAKRSVAPPPSSEEDSS